MGEEKWNKELWENRSGGGVMTGLKKIKVIKINKQKEVRPRIDKTILNSKSHARDVNYPRFLVVLQSYSNKNQNGAGMKADISIIDIEFDSTHLWTYVF